MHCLYPQQQAANRLQPVKLLICQVYSSNFLLPQESVGVSQRRAMVVYTTIFVPYSKSLSCICPSIDKQPHHPGRNQLDHAVRVPAGGKAAEQGRAAVPVPEIDVSN